MFTVIIMKKGFSMSSHTLTLNFVKQITYHWIFQSQYLQKVNYFGPWPKYQPTVQNFAFIYSVKLKFCTRF